MTKPATPPPAAYQTMIENYPEVMEAYEKLGEACHLSGPLDAKTRELIKLGQSMGAGLESASHAHIRLAIEAGATHEELRHAVLLATTTLGFPAMRRAMAWVDDVVA